MGVIGVTGVRGSEWDCAEICWLDSARARANMRAVFLGGGGGAVVGAAVLREREEKSFEESEGAMPSWLLTVPGCCELLSPFRSLLSSLSKAANLDCNSIWKASLREGSTALRRTLPMSGEESLGSDGGDND